MTLLALAIVRDADPFRGPLPPGPGGDPLTLVSADGLAFVCAAGPAGEPDVPRLLAFAGTVQALHALGTVLPLRFGATGREGEFRAKLSARRAEFLADLARLDGLEEMTVRFTVPPPDAPPAAALPAASGTAYLLARRRQYQEADARREAAERVVAAARERLAGRFTELAADRPAADGSSAVHFLVPRGSGPAFAAAARAAGCFPADARVLGPWPAYHFLTPPPTLLPGTPARND